jgi:hypothetical protein
MLPYLTVSSVVGWMSGTTSAITPELWNLDRTSAARAADMPAEEGHVDCFFWSRGDAVAEAARRSSEIDFMFAMCSNNL